ncbi:MAG TPA: squalene/phytoene synthase family protein [Acidimicrobiales bacterium]|nr:squalene/phytoene synthase family protein [Acidimicrobiales bacterium]
MNDIVEAYRACETITKVEARNFSYGIRLLPARKRAAMSALYAFARRVDDIGDGDLDVNEKRVQLANVRAQIMATAAGNPPEGDPVLLALCDAMHHFPISVDQLGEIITGCELDGERQRWESYSDLEHYCTLVAGSVGRLSLSIFGTNQPTRGAQLANRLGIGLQITNILRDVVEDRETMGRVYLPQEDLRRFGCAEDATGPIDQLVELVRLEVSRAKMAYGEGLELLDLLDYRSRACVSAMAGIYHRLLERIEEDPAAIFSSRVSLSAGEKVRVSLRALGGVQI